MSKFAAKTDVPVIKSRMEIETILARYGADAFGYHSDANGAAIAFRMNDRRVKFLLPLPRKDAPQFTHYKRGYQTVPRTENAALAQWEQACRQRWRALALVVKAKLEAVECGISEFEDEFLANIVLPNGKLLGEAIRPQIAVTYETGNMPPLLGYDGKQHDHD